MRITATLQHGKYFWWGKGFGYKPRKNTDNFYWKMQWNAKRRRQVETIPQILPEGVSPIDPNRYVKESFHEGGRLDFILPWPHANRPVKGSPDDPKYKPEAAYVYHRNRRLVEPLNLPLNFTNTILEQKIPERIQHFQEQISLDDVSLELAKRRINWCLNNDSAMRKLPLNRTFPYLDQRPPRVFGVPENRKESNLLRVINDIANENSAKMFGVNSDVVLQRITNPNCNLSFERDNKNVMLNLESDFVTLLQNIKPNIQVKLPQFEEKNLSTNNDLASIHPLSWEAAFESQNFYQEDTKFLIPKDSLIQTIYLSNNQLRKLKDIDFQGRAIMFCFGYAVQQAKLLHETDNLEDIHLESPINVQCIFSNQDGYRIGSVLFELNSVKFSDKSNLNRAWILPVNSVLDNLELALKNVITLNSNGVHF